MSRIDKENFKPPPFNMSRAYEVFNKESVCVIGVDLAESLSERYETLGLPDELMPLTTVALDQGQMFLCWNANQTCMGYALHKKVT